MVYDATMLEAFYPAYKGKVEHVRAILKRPLTLAEKILYAHLYDVADVKDYQRGEDYVIFVPTVLRCRMRQPRWLCFNL